MTGDAIDDIGSFGRACYEWNESGSYVPKRLMDFQANSQTYTHQTHAHSN